jgi:hypothetical protein
MTFGHWEKHLQKTPESIGREPPNAQDGQDKPNREPRHLSNGKPAYELHEKWRTMQSGIAQRKTEALQRRCTSVASKGMRIQCELEKYRLSRSLPVWMPSQAVPVLIPLSLPTPH